MISVALWPRNGRTPVAISYSTTPSANRSPGGPTASPRACSGDMYDTVPIVVPGDVTSSTRDTVRSSSPPPPAPAVAAERLARPKSSSFASPCSVTKMFAGLMSR